MINIKIQSLNLFSKTTYSPFKETREVLKVKVQIMQEHFTLR